MHALLGLWGGACLRVRIHPWFLAPRRCRPPTISRRWIWGIAGLRNKTMSSATATTSPPAIVSAIRPAFEKGKASGDLLFFPSEVHTHRDLGIDVGKKNHSTFITAPYLQRLVRDKTVSGAFTKAYLAYPAIRGGRGGP